MPDDVSAHSNSHDTAARTDVPVFNCHVYLFAADNQGVLTARVANLAGIEAQGLGERDALRRVVEKFKATVSGYLARGEAIPWQADPNPAPSGAVQRFVPVHF